jgi:ABC-type nitrate/sulfonate/bicarbonate transport system substrate-binding protein
MVTAAGGLTACGTSAGAASPPAAKSVTTLTFLAEAGAVPEDAIEVYGDASGIFRKNGFYLDIKPISGMTGTSAPSFLKSGQTDLALVDGPSFLEAYQGGIQLEAVAGQLQNAPTGILINKASGVTSLAGLAGHTVGVETSTDIVDSDLLLKKAGVNPSTVKFETLSYAATATAMINKSVAGIVGFIPLNEPLFDAVGMKLAIYPFTSVGINYLYWAVGVTRQFAQTHASLMPGIVKGISEAETSIESHVAETAAAYKAEVGSAAAATPVLESTVRLIAADSLTRTKYDTGHPDGWMSAADWNLTKSYAVANITKSLSSVPVTAIYTDKYFNG